MTWCDVRRNIPRTKYKNSYKMITTRCNAIYYFRNPVICIILLTILPQKTFTNNWARITRRNSTVQPNTSKVRVLPIQATKAIMVGRGRALPYLRPRHWRLGWGVSTTPRPLYPRGKTRYPLYRRLVGSRTGLDGCGKSFPHWDSIPGPSNP